MWVCSKGYIGVREGGREGICTMMRGWIKGTATVTICWHSLSSFISLGCMVTWTTNTLAVANSPPTEHWLIESWYKSAVTRVYGLYPLSSYMYSLWLGSPAGINITTLRVQIPYTLETHGTTIPKKGKESGWGKGVRRMCEEEEGGVHSPQMMSTY